MTLHNFAFTNSTVQSFENSTTAAREMLFCPPQVGKFAFLLGANKFAQKQKFKNSTDHNQSLFDLLCMEQNYCPLPLQVSFCSSSRGWQVKFSAKGMMSNRHISQLNNYLLFNFHGLPCCPLMLLSLLFKASLINLELLL